VYRFLLSWRWLGAFLLTVAIAAGCVLLGNWQWHRREARLAANAVVTNNYDREPVTLSQALDNRGSLPRSKEWTPVELTGSYLAQDALLLRNRPLNGQPGYHSLVPFVSDDGPVVLVDRGWLPVGQTGSAPDSNPAPPDGKVRVVVRLRPAEPADSRADTAGQPERQVRRIAPAAVPLPGVDRSKLVSDAYGVLAQEVPAPSEAPQKLPKPEVDEGPHLSYALQWFAFGVGAFVGLWVLVRRTAEDDSAADAVPGATAVPRRPARPRRPTAEEEEDALIEAQLGQTVTRPLDTPTDREGTDGPRTG
jgi:cytochrome oxidase assembly protein ShyY1